MAFAENYFDEGVSVIFIFGNVYIFEIIIEHMQYFLNIICASYIVLYEIIIHY